MRERLAVVDREHRIGAAVDDARRNSDGGERLVRRIRVDQPIVVLRRREVTGAFHVALNQVTGPGLLEWAFAAGQRSRIRNQVLDHRSGVGPVDLYGRCEPSEVTVRWRELAGGRDRGRGADQNERED